MMPGPPVAGPRHLDPARGPEDPPSRWLVFWATFLLVSGRVVLAAMVLLALGCRLALGSEWHDRHPTLGDVAIVAALALWMLWVPLLLPVAHPALLIEVGPDLIGRTVLGRRRIRLAAARRREISFWFGSSEYAVATLRAPLGEPGAHLLILAKVGTSDDGSGLLGWLRGLAVGAAVLVGTCVLGLVPAALLLWLSGVLTP